MNPLVSQLCWGPGKGPSSPPVVGAHACPTRTAEPKTWKHKSSSWSFRSALVEPRQAVSPRPLDQGGRRFATASAKKKPSTPLKRFAFLSSVNCLLKLREEELRLKLRQEDLPFKAPPRRFTFEAPEDLAFGASAKKKPSTPLKRFAFLSSVNCLLKLCEEELRLKLRQEDLPFNKAPPRRFTFEAPEDLAFGAPSEDLPFKAAWKRFAF